MHRHFRQSSKLKDVHDQIKELSLSNSSLHEREALKRVKKRVEKLRQSVYVSHNVGKDDWSTIRGRQKRAISAVSTLLDETNDPYLELLLNELIGAIEEL